MLTYKTLTLVKDLLGYVQAREDVAEDVAEWGYVQEEVQAAEAAVADLLKNGQSLVEEELKTLLQPYLDKYNPDEYLSSLHVFSDQRDSFLSVQNLETAARLFVRWSSECGCARVYFDYSKEDGEVVEEECLLSFGRYPD